ncbi:MAG: hydrolase [Pseudomonadota bacterium]
MAAAAHPQTRRANTSGSEPVGGPRVWQRMLSGRRLDLLQPDPKDIELTDIAHGLARVARWNGQTRGDHAFSVAQHSVVVRDVVMVLEPGLGREAELAALLHDAAEYVIGDLISPFKSSIGGAYRDIESGLLAAIYRRFEIDPAAVDVVTGQIKRADRIAAYHEATGLAGFDPLEAETYFGRPPPLPDTLTTRLTALQAVSANAAQKTFFDACNRLLAGHDPR